MKSNNIIKYITIYSRKKPIKKLTSIIILTFLTCTVVNAEEKADRYRGLNEVKSDAVAIKILNIYKDSIESNNKQDLLDLLGFARDLCTFTGGGLDENCFQRRMENVLDIE